MKHSTFAKSALALVFGLCATGALATTEKPVKEDFQGDAFASGINGVTTNNLSWTDTEGGSEVSGGKLLVDAATTPTSATIDSTAAKGINAAFGHNAKFNATVTFVPATEEPPISDTSDLKFALYAKAVTTPTAATNLWVIADGGAADTEIALTSVIDQNIEIAFTAANTFTVKVGNSTSRSFTFAKSGDISKVEFSGNGEVDNIEFSYDANWDSLLGAPVNGAYEIDSPAELVAFQKGVADGLTTAGVTFKQTANIDMASAGAFAGIGTYAKVPTAGTPFLGTYNGQNYKISNVTRAGGNTVGIFNQVGPSGVIENLVVENMAFDSSLSGEYGCAIVGNAGGGATLRNLTAAGTFGSASKPGTHNMAGIVVRLAPGATAGAATTIDSCTNNATIYGAYTKLGGINAIVQTQTGFKAGKVVFVNCANNGTLVCKRTAAQCAELDADNNPKTVTGQAGIVAYSSAIVELTGCYGNGVITNSDGANTDKDGALVGWQYTGYAFKDNGGNSAPADKKMIAYYGNVANVTGFQYATVANGVATTISGSPVAGGTYLLEGNAAPAITLAVGESVTFDTSLGYTLDDTGIVAAEDLVVEKTTSGTVKTFTAAEAPSYAADDSISVKGGSYTISADEAAYLNALVEDNDASTVETALAGVTGAQLKDAVLLNQDVTKGNAASATLSVESVKRNGGKVVVTVSLTRNGTILGAIRGKIILKACATPNGQFDPVAEQYFEKSAGENSGISQTFTKEFDPVAGKTFFKAEVVPVPAE